MSAIICGIILILVLILIIVGLVYYLVYRVKTKVESVTQDLFGTRDIAKVADKMQHELSTTPKSVSGMTRIVLPDIVKDFPDFKYDEMRAKAENVLVSYLRAVTDLNQGLLQEGNSELKNQLENHISQLKMKDQHEYFERIKVHQTEIFKYMKKAGRCIVTFQTSVEYFHRLVDVNGKLLAGSKENKYQTKYNIDLIYIQDRDIVENELDNALGVNCPNCGAPLKSLGKKYCDYCGSAVVELNIHAWSFSSVEEQ